MEQKIKLQKQKKNVFGVEKGKIKKKMSNLQLKKKQENKKKRDRKKEKKI